MQQRQALSILRHSTNIIDNVQTYGHTNVKSLYNHGAKSQISDKVVRQVTDQLASQVKPAMNAAGQRVLYVGKRPLSDIVSESARRRNVGPLVKALGMNTNDPALQRLANTQLSESAISTSLRSRRQTIMKDLDALMESPQERKLLHSRDPLPESSAAERVASNFIRPPKRRAPEIPSNSAEGNMRGVVSSTPPKGANRPSGSASSIRGDPTLSGSGDATGGRVKPPSGQKVAVSKPAVSSDFTTMEKIWRNGKLFLKASAVIGLVVVAGHSLVSWIAEYKVKNSGAFSHTVLPQKSRSRLQNLSCGCSDTTTGVVKHIYHDKIAAAVAGIENACTSAVGLPDGALPTNNCGDWLDFGPYGRLQKLGILEPEDLRTSPLGPNTTYKCHAIPTNGEALAEFVYATGRLVGELVSGVVSGVADGLGIRTFGKVLAATIISALSGLSSYHIFSSYLTLQTKISANWIALCVTVFVFIFCIYMFFFSDTTNGYVDHVDENFSIS